MLEHPSQKLMAVSGAFLGGVAAASLIKIPPAYIYFAIILLVGFAAVAAGRKNGPVILMIAAAFVGGAWRYISVSGQSDALKGIAGNNNNELSGIVDGDFGETQSGRGRFPFLVLLPDGHSERTIVYTTAFPDYKYGENLKIKGRLQIPESFSDFDYPGYLRMQGIGTILYAENIEKIPDANKIPLPVRIWGGIYYMRDKFIISLNNSIPEPVASYTAGILVGQRTGISPDMQEAFRRTGTSHILAVSGYNITIIAEAVLALCVLFIRRQKAVWLAGIIVVVFVIMSGASASVVRAGLMGLLILLATAAGRLSDAGISVTLAAAVMAYVNPMILKFDIGFQLSFAAVIGLIYIRPLFIHLFRKIPGSVVKDILATTVAAQVMALPILIYNFESVSVMLIPANLLVLPFLPLVMALGFSAGIAGLVLGVAGQFIGYWTWAIGTYQLNVIEILAQVPWAALDAGMSVHAVWIYYLAVITGVYYLRRKYGDYVHYF